MASLHGSPVAGEIRSAVEGWLDTLDDAQRRIAVLPFDDEERRVLLLAGCRELLEQGRRASESIDAEVRAEVLAELEQ